MTDYLESVHHGSVAEETYTPLPSHIHKKTKFKKILFFSLVPLFLIIAIIVGYMQYQNYLKIKGSIGTTSDRIIPTPTPTTIIQISPTSVPNEGVPPIPVDWAFKKSRACNISLMIPPAEEPYIVPRDPNTPPSATDEEGSYWIFEETDIVFFMFQNMVRAIFKNPEAPGSGYVSSAVEVYCSENTEKYTTDSLMKKLETDLNENFSVIQVKEILDDDKWGIPVKVIRFQGGNFGNEQYNLLATESNIYLIRSFGESSNSDVKDVQNQIFLNIKFD